MLIWCTIAPDIVYGVASLVSCVLCRYVVAHHVCDRRYTVHLMTDLKFSAMDVE
jgi:hypothetical protein